MKKLFLMVFMLSAVASFANGLKDGKYWVEDAEFKYGWKSFTAITVEGGEIVSVKHDKFNADGDYVSKDAEYNKNMKAKSGSNPEEFTKALEEDFMAKKDIDKVDTVAGATSSTNTFKKQMKFLMEVAEEGKQGKHVYK